MGGILVFSHGGALLRRIHGEWSQPEHLWVVDDRLYLVEVTGNFTSAARRKQAGRRILVLSPNGRLLQTFAPTAWQRPEVRMECGVVVFGQQLLVHIGVGEPLQTVCGV